MRQYSVTFTDQEAGWLKGVGSADRPRPGRHSSRHQLTLVGQFPCKGSLDVAERPRGSLHDVIGMPAIRYLTLWRLQAAKLSLRETRKTMAQLAREVGYGSDGAFSRAFKRKFGPSPAWWRHQPPADWILRTAMTILWKHPVDRGPPHRLRGLC